MINQCSCTSTTSNDRKEFVLFLKVMLTFSYPLYLLISAFFFSSSNPTTISTILFGVHTKLITFQNRLHALMQCVKAISTLVAIYTIVLAIYAVVTPATFLQNFLLHKATSSKHVIRRCLEFCCCVYTHTKHRFFSIYLHITKGARNLGRQVAYFVSTVVCLPLFFLLLFVCAKCISVMSWYCFCYTVDIYMLIMHWVEHHIRVYHLK